MFVNWLLLFWTACAAVWWLLSLRLVRRPARQPSFPATSPHGAGITVFKPLPPLRRPEEQEALGRAVASFSEQLGPDDELLLGVDARDEPAWRTWSERNNVFQPGEKIRWILRPGAAPVRHANPKLDWQHFLAPHARNEFWLWSDADITAPAGYLDTVRNELTAETGLVTNAYLVKKIGTMSQMLDALFVNAEFFPGVQLLARKKTGTLGLGAGLLFRKRDFEKRIDWDDFGAHLADDFYLGRELAPSRVGATVLETFPSGTGWKNAVLHYYRWQKTVRWSEPRGFAGQLAILPLLPWLCAWALHPGTLCFAWGAAGVIVCETMWAVLLLRSLRCSVHAAAWPGIPCWSVIRVAVWIACWLPLPVSWRGVFWWSGLKKNGNKEPTA